MPSSKKILITFLSLVVVTATLFPQPLHAARSSYYDFGPYYQTSQVLGFSLSVLENLPAPQIPDNLMPPTAKGILPGNPFYGLERAWENTQVAFTFNPVAREQLRLKIAEERLSEAKTLMDQGQIQAASQALDDYGKTVGDIAKNLATIAQSNTPQAQELINKVEQTAAAQAVVATALSVAAPPAQAENWTDAGNNARDILDKIAETRGEPAIPENLSNGLQELKEQGLISEEESNKIYGLKNRSEVREELIKLNSAGGLPPSEITKLDEGVAKYYPEVQDQQIANWQVMELRSYQALNQPNEKQVEELKKWQDNQDVPPSNDIKPYLWYNRAQDLVKEVDLSNFSQTQQADLVKYYPEAQGNPTYSSPPSPSPSPSPSPAPTDQATTPSPSPTDQPSPSPTSVPADPYLQDPGVLPGQPTYIIKQFGEGLSLTFTFDPAQKARLKFEQAERRLAEAAALSDDPKKAGLYESTLKTYRETLADAANRVKNLPEGREVRRVAERLEAQAARHEVVFEKGLLPAPAKNPRLLAEVIKTTEDALDRSADALDRPALPPALASRLDDLKAQGLILEEEAENLVRSNSREEAREKIRELVEQKGFPLADAKKMDEAQSRVSPADYNQLVEVRKVEELQNLRAVQTDLAQTPTLKQQASQLDQKASSLGSFFDPSLIKPEDLAGREHLVKAYEKLASVPRPINGGQFGAEATPGAQPVVTPSSPRDAVLTTCPEGATFKQFEGCVWADTGRKINDYDQYKCDGPRQYYSFAAKKCVASDPAKGYQEDAQPICPIGYTWSWPTQSCQTSTGGILPYPSPSAQPELKDDQEREERSKNCPEGSSYQPPNGCVWDKTGKSIYDSEQYRCGRGQYYSFEEGKCVANLKEGEPYPKNTNPVCKQEGAYWSWNEGKCIYAVEPSQKEKPGIIIDDFRPPFIAPNSPFYIIKQAAERVQLTLALTTPARQQVTLAQAEERLAEAADALRRNDAQAAKKAINTYTNMMQNIVADVSKESLTEMAKNKIAKQLKEEAAEHNLLLEKLQALAPEELDTPISAAVSVSILGVDKAADIAGEPPIPDEVKSKIEALPEKMISEENKKALLEMDSRVDARLKLGGLLTNGALTQTEISFLNEEFDKVDPEAKFRVEELKKLEEIADASESKEKLVEKVEKNEEIAQKLAEFEKTFEVGKEVPAEIRPYIRLIRINEVAQTIRPDIVRLEDFQNRKDVLLAVATLQEEFKPTKESWAKVENFRRRNPGAYLPPELARIEALSFSLGVRNQAGPCYLPTPPFAPNTPCPAPGAAIPITSYVNYIVEPADWDFPVYRPGYPGRYIGGLGSGGPNTGYGNVGAPSLDKDGKPFVYGQGPKPEKTGICPDGYHWMYDSGGWCMSNAGSYSSSYNYTPTGPQTAGYTPYSPYYNAPGAPPATYGYPVGGNYPGSPYSYSPPSYYGPGSTYYTTTPPTGTVPGSGPKPTAPGQCPQGFHWMSDSGGWCMADGPTYVPPGGQPYGSSYPAGTSTSDTPPPGGYNCGSQPYDPVTKKCKDGACPGGFNWDGSKCVAGGYSGGGSTPWCWSAFPSPDGWGCESGSSWDQASCSCKPSGSTYTGGGYSPGSSYQSGCTPGYYWDGSKCVAGSYEGGGWSDTSARSQSWCQPPASGCGSNSYWDYGSCYCRSSSTYYGGSGPSPSNQCQGLSCGGGAWLDYATCSCKYSGGSGTSSTGSTITCYPPSAGCPGGWYDYGTCSCKISSTTTTNTGCANVSASSCGSGWYWDSAACTCRSSTTSSGGGTSSGGTSSGGTSSGSCPSGYHWMSDNGGWCMSDGGGSSSGGSTTSPSPSPSSSPAPSSEPAPAPSPSSEPAPSSPSPSP